MLHLYLTGAVGDPGVLLTFFGRLTFYSYIINTILITMMSEIGLSKVKTRNGPIIRGTIYSEFMGSEIANIICYE